MNFRMLRSVKQLLWTAGIIIGCQSAFGFALLGPVPGTGVGVPDSFQTPALFYGVGGFTTAGGIVSVLGGYAASPAISAVLDGGLIGVQPSDDMGTPKNIAEGYRRNTPVM